MFLTTTPPLATSHWGVPALSTRPSPFEQPSNNTLTADPTHTAVAMQGKEVWSFWNTSCFSVMAFYAVALSCTFIFMVGKEKPK